MAEDTALDRAHAAMQAEPEDTAARLRFFERLLDGELFLLLEREAEGDDLTPEVFPVEGIPYVLVFDREERLAGFVGRQAPYAALSGRLIVSLLQGQGIGIGVNLDAAPSETLLPAGAVDWMAGMLAQRPEQAEARPEAFHPPASLPGALLTGLDAKLAAAAGLAPLAYVAGVSYAGGGRSHMLAFIDAVEGAEAALAQAAGEALAFSGIEAGSIDVAFFDAADPVAAKLAKVGLRIDLPQPEAPEILSPAAPGMDPDKPPKLR